MSQYEMMVIFKSQVMAEDSKAPLAVVEKLVTQHKGKITATDDWGEKSLTYSIEGHDRGYYIVYKLEMDPAQVAKFNAKMILNKDALRFLFLLDTPKKEKV